MNITEMGNGSHIVKVLVAAAVCVIIASDVAAQVAIPNVQQTAVRQSAGITPAEGWMDLVLYNQWLDAEVLSQRSAPKLDLVNANVESRASRWLNMFTRSNNSSALGFHNDYVMGIASAGNRDSIARSILALRASSSGLSVADKAALYLAGIRTFTRGRADADLVLAESYMSSLNQLGPEAVYWRLAGHGTLAVAYSESRQNAKVIEHGLKAVTLMPEVPFEFRRPIYSLVVLKPLFEALHNSNGSQALTKVVQQLQSAASPPANIVFGNPQMAFEAAKWKKELASIADLVSLIGKPAPPLTGNMWSEGEAHSLNDGHVHVIAMPVTGNPPVLGALAQLERLKERFGNDVHVIISPRLSGHMGYKFTSYDEEAKHLTDVIRNRLKVQATIVWNVAAKKENQDGGMVPQVDPNWVAYRRNTLIPPDVRYITDKQGILRHIVFGGDLHAESGLNALIADIVSK